MEIIRASPSDAARLTQIAHAAKRHWGYPEHWISLWNDALTIRPEFIQQNLTFLARRETSVVGFHALMVAGDLIWLQHLWVVPESMGQGIGRALCFHAAEQAHGLGFSSMHIEADPNAEGFYLRLGACRCGARATRIDGQTRELPLLSLALPCPTIPTPRR